jgi:3-hydroxybutyryl-CoA dehydratase
MQHLTTAPVPGDRIRGRTRTITEADLVAFGSLTGDFHPQHLDRRWAESSAFGSRVAHGMLVVSYSIGMIGFDPERVVALRGLDSVRFKRPVRIGETLAVEAVVREVVALEPPLSLVDFGWTISTEESGTVVKARVQAIWRDLEAALPPSVAGSDPAEEGGERALYPDGVLL